MGETDTVGAENDIRQRKLQTRQFQHDFPPQHTQLCTSKLAKSGMIFFFLPPHNPGRATYFHLLHQVGAVAGNEAAEPSQDFAAESVRLAADHCGQTQQQNVHHHHNTLFIIQQCSASSQHTVQHHHNTLFGIITTHSVASSQHSVQHHHNTLFRIITTHCSPSSQHSVQHYHNTLFSIIHHNTMFTITKMHCASL